MKVFKYPLTGVRSAIELPEGAQVLCVKPQQNDAEVGVYLWALVDPDAPLEERTFEVVGTGIPLESKAADYVGSLTLPTALPLVLHIFEDKKADGN